MKLSDKQERFCEEYLIDLNATQSAIRAGYAEKSARTQGSRLLTNDDIQKRISQLQADRSHRVKVDADYVLRRLVDMAELDYADIFDDNFCIKPISEWSETWRKALNGIEVTELFQRKDKQKVLIGFIKSIKMPKREKLLELIAKHNQVNAFGTQVDDDEEVKAIKVTVQAVDASEPEEKYAEFLRDDE